MHAAVKATYLTSVSLIFAFWFALGADRLRQASPRWFHRVGVVCAMLATACIVVFTNNLCVARNWLVSASTNSAPWQNIYGIVHYAGGDRERARELFELATQGGWHLAEENLGYLLLHDGRPLEALYHVRNAARLQPQRSFGTRADRTHFDRINQADYQNQMAIIYYELGWRDLALASAEKAHELDDSIPEIEYDLAILKLAHALSRTGADETQIARAVAQSRALLFSAAMKDPAFFEIAALSGVVDALDGNCERAVPTIRAALAPHPNQYRAYPVTTGPGNVHAAALGRRTYITALPEILRPEYQLERCSAQAVATE
jgi:tetratricopeptide (TPR) repeat protein